VIIIMTDPINGAAAPEEDELVDYEEDQTEEANQAKGTENLAKKGYVGIHSTGFKDFLLKPELLRAIVDCGFEHPSEGGCNQLGASLSWQGSDICATHCVYCVA